MPLDLRCRALRAIENCTIMKPPERFRARAIRMKLRAPRLAIDVLLTVVVAGCGDGSSTVLIGGTVGGLLSGRSVVLQDSGVDTTTVTTNTTFTFSAPVASESLYRVTVLAQPLGQTCLVNNGSGTVATTNVSNVSVVCSTNSYKIGATITGLAGAGLVLQDNGADNLSISASGSVDFAKSVASGSTYKVTVLIQPAGQRCSITSGTGTVGAVSIKVAVSCMSLPNAWNWVDGSNIVGASGIYGSLGTAAAGNMPGARYGAVSWTESGNVWVLGGQGYDSAGTLGALNDLWEYSAGQWMWMSGSHTANATGTYGTQGITANGNMPGARFAALSWTDSSGDLWLSGGQGYDSAGTQGLLNDLWKYSAGRWTWVSGSNTVNATGAYGTKGIGAPGNVPGGRFAADSWTDSSGDLWLFGGIGYDSAGAQGFLNDLWKYRAGRWAWVSGSNSANAIGTYGTKGIAAAGNVPSARLRAITWMDSAGNIWLFGGLGFDSVGAQGALNDLWEYSSGQWKWVSGSNTINASGSYGIKGIAAPGNVPGGRYAAISWVDSSGNVWLFGGQGNNSAGNQFFLNDLWEYSSGQWKWVSGSNTINASGSYGTKGIAAAGNIAGARYAAISWLDSSGDLWLFGGVGYDAAGTQGGLNDQWKYTP
jgi:galactose oxidase-like protein